MMVSLLIRLMTWEFILSVGRLFHSLSSQSHRSFILVQLTLVMVHPLLNLLTPKGLPIALVTRGLKNIGCLRTSASVVGSSSLDLPSRPSSLDLPSRSSKIRGCLSRTSRSFFGVWG